MSKFLLANDDTKSITIPLVFSKNSRAKKNTMERCDNSDSKEDEFWLSIVEAKKAITSHSNNYCE